MASLADILHDALAGSRTGCLHPKFDLAQCDSLAVVLDAAGVTVGLDVEALWVAASFTGISRGDAEIIAARLCRTKEVINVRS